MSENRDETNKKVGEEKSRTRKRGGKRLWKRSSTERWKYGFLVLHFA